MSTISDESDSYSLSAGQISSKILIACSKEFVNLCLSWSYNNVWELTYELYSLSIAFYCFIASSNSFFKSKLLFTIEAQFSHSTACNVMVPRLWMGLLSISSITGLNLPWSNWNSMMSLSWTRFIMTLSSLTLVTGDQLQVRLKTYTTIRTLFRVLYYHSVPVLATFALKYFTCSYVVC